MRMSEWEKVKCKDLPRKFWLPQVDSLKKEFDLQDKVLDIKSNQKALGKDSVKSLRWP